MECERLDIFFHKVLRAGLEKQLPHHFKDTPASQALVCLIYKVKTCPDCR